MTTSTPTTPSAPHPRKLLREKEVAEIYGISHKLLQQWRHRHVGPPYVRAGRAIRYRLADMDEFFEKNLVIPNA